ncbi:M28 family peptidase [Sphingomonas sp. KR1UV-12]|uniref:M28 family peptidase n=1 Tax=Sphingomonas aurea TaxID=3063994 RepID=A0ABT9ELT3_9SPHN|nr:M28 family peptidase [Sphingomonas sp. KR1UV-12]MDP1027914.1 M28 family peptidase [Sphingomonas sp. KR1UV-12]
MLRFPAALLALALSGAGSAAPADLEKINAALPPDQAAMKAHVMFLASDAMKGREAGSPEYDIAAQYVAAQFYAAGLRPGGDDGGYLQRVPLVTYKPAGQGSFVWSAPGGAPRPLAFGTDYVPSGDPSRAETSVSAPVVFVGYGIDAPGEGVDSYGKTDVRGRIVAYVRGAPASLDGEERAFFGQDAQKLRMAAARGAVGAVVIADPDGTPQAMTALAARYDAGRMNWAEPDGRANAPAPTAPLLGTLSPVAGRALFGKDWAGIAAAAASDTPRYRPVRAAGTLTVALRTDFTPATSSNVVGLLPGSDPKLAREIVVLSAHLDHIGVNASGTGDRINNGALDNAIGIASLIEEAKRFTGKPPKRTLMFLAVTAEEKGLVGADYFAQHPTVARDRLVADVNLDMPMLLYPFSDMNVYGADRSTLGPIVARAVAAGGATMSPDPAPEQGFFVRSDHFRFVQQGIPSVFLWPGRAGEGKAASEKFLSTCYHRPCDDLSQPILWDQGVRFVDINYRIAREIADAPARPVWNKGDYFGRLYKGPMARK